MKINGNDALNIPKPQSGKVYEPEKTSRDTAPKRTAAAPSSDGIDLGSQSGLLSLAQTVGSNASDTRVQELRAQVQSGQYQVDTRALAGSIVSAVLNRS